MEWYLRPFRKYVAFYGRARRREYWTFVLINSLIGGLLSVIGANTEMLFLPGIFSAIILIPTFAVAVRRLHDVGKSGIFLLIGIVPLLGQIVLFIFFIKDSDPGDNKYGPSPKKRYKQTY